jgi:carboxyl-terminal processing protease
MRVFRSPWLVIALLSAASLGGGAWAAKALKRAPAPDGSRPAQAFREALQTIRENHVDRPGRDELFGSATRGLLSSLDDPYAELLTDDAYRRYNDRMSGTRLGLRLQLRTHSGGSAGSALRSLRADAGIDPRDEILAVNGVSTIGWTPADAARALAGDKGTTVTLLVRPFGSTTSEIRRVARTAVHVPAVSRGVVLRDGTGYLSFETSTEAAPSEMRAAIADLRRRGMRRLVLDLRQNPGGLIPQAVAIADLFLDPGDTIAITRGRNAESSRVFVDRERQPWPRMPVALLVNRGTASAAELIAGALQDHDRARIVGTSTYGKGVIQTTFPLGTDVAVKFTTARWYTPSGRSVQRSDSTYLTPAKVFRSEKGRKLTEGEGIVPDVIVKQVRPPADLVLDRAFGEDMPIFEVVMARYVAELAAAAGPQARSGTVTPGMQEELWRRLAASGIATPRRIFDRVTPYVREKVSDELVSEVWGEEPALRRRLASDRQVQTAIASLVRGRP